MNYKVNQKISIELEKIFYKIVMKNLKTFNLIMKKNKKIQTKIVLIFYKIVMKNLKTFNFIMKKNKVLSNLLKKIMKLI